MSGLHTHVHICLRHIDVYTHTCKHGHTYKKKKTISKMMDLNPSITIITLNVNGVNLFKRLRLSDKTKKQDLTVFYILLFETYTLNTKTQVG